MSANKLSRSCVGLACLLALGTPMSGFAANATQINSAIDKGLDYLSANQAGAGYWAYGGYEQAATGAAAFAMLSQKSQWDAGKAATYQTQVDNAMNWLLGQATVATVSTRYNDTSNAGGAYNICPGGVGPCKAVYWYGAGESTYTTGLIASAIATYGAANPDAVATASGPLAGMTWKQIAQGITNTFSAAQAANNTGNRWGGWRYGLPANTDADSSTTQWAAIAMLYSQTLGAVTPPIVRSDLANHWLPAAQAANGSACYQPNTGPCDQADTGGMLLSMAFTGKTMADPAVQRAVSYLNNNWRTGPSDTWYGNFGHPYAMWAEYKGLETMVGLADTTHLTNLLDPTCGAGGNPANAPPSTCNWWQDDNEWLVRNQNADGGWDGYGYWYGPLATAFYLPILGGTAIPDDNQTPEPGTVVLVGAAIAALSLHRRRAS